MVIEHPFNNRYAFVLTDKDEHYRTDDRGKTWRPFKVPLPPARVFRPLSFHASQGMDGYILYQGTSCEGRGWGAVCHDETYYTTAHFSDEPKKLLDQTSRCQFAHSSKTFKADVPKELIFCVAFDTSTNTGSHALSSSRLFSSTDFFQNDNKVEDLGIGKNAKGVIAFAIISKYAVVALKDLSPGNNGEMLLYVSLDGLTWAKAQFPHASSAQLRENAYTIVESTTYSLAVDVVLQDRATIGTLFMSNSNGTFFVESLKDTNRNERGFVDYERMYGVDGIGLANVVSNAKDVEGRGAEKQVKTVITYDDGSNWQPVRAPSRDFDGRPFACNPADAEECSLHLYSITTPHNFGRVFSSPAPGFAMGVGSVGPTLLPYRDSDTFLSTDAGVTWSMVRPGAHKYEFGDSGSILVVVNDEEPTDKIQYSTDLGKTWKSYDLGVKLLARGLMTLPDSTSQKFLLLGQVARRDQTNDIGRVVIVFLDFAQTRPRKCTDDDFERWYARSGQTECLMGHKQWYKRRKPNVDCYVGEKYQDPVEHEVDCECTDADYECDYNFVRSGQDCVPVGPEPIAAGVCNGDPNQTYLGSSGYRKVVGFAKFSEFLVVASAEAGGRSLELQVSLDGYHFATGQFPVGMHPETHAYTVLESSTKALFLHMTMSEDPFYGNILKSNSNGTYFGVSIENVNRNDAGYVDFEKMIGLDGIALINVVSNPAEAKVSREKKLQTRITHNDGSTWKPLTPPKVDSQGRPYGCNEAKCALHFHGYTERLDPRATYSSPSVVGLIMAVGNVGTELAPYTESDTFLSRDGGFTWEEVHKDAHLWEFGDSGSILVMVNDEEPTDHVLFSTDEGLNWREYKFTDDKIRVRFVVTVPSDTSRRFILLGNYPRSSGSVAIHIDFSALTSKQCVLSLDNPGQDDFELWSPSEEREERCLFGRQTLYHRRVRNTNCVVGKQPKAEEKIVSNCPCAKVDFECEFNYVKNEADECVLSPGATPLANDEAEACKGGADYWYERTAYRLIPYSSCEDGLRLDRGSRHACPGFKAHGFFFWLFVLVIPFGITALVAYSYYRRSGLARGTIRLPGDGGSSFRQESSGVLDTIASVPWFIVGISGIAWEWVTSRTEGLFFRSRRGYRDLRVDEDAQILRFEDEE
ncbi:hypothetical protein H0H92_010132 [Tricholoma furcatifolium]|nr:hypothetical protein H0H92_010132 [Tricholoma furcatifolium]